VGGIPRTLRLTTLALGGQFGLGNDRVGQRFYLRV
jgi:hypothetical protein